MSVDLAALPNDVDTLHRMIGELATTLDSERAEAQAEIERLRLIVRALQRGRFGRVHFPQGAHLVGADKSISRMLSGSTFRIVVSELTNRDIRCWY